MSDFDDVGDFHEKFGLTNVTHEGPGRREIPPGLLEFRIAFLHEELEEFEEGFVDGDHAKMADALIDLVYVAMGTAHLLGYPWQQLWQEVQRANMEKMRASTAEESKRGSVFDVVKPDGWEPPDIDAVLQAFFGKTTF